MQYQKGVIVCVNHVDASHVKHAEKISKTASVKDVANHPPSVVVKSRSSMKTILYMAMTVNGKVAGAGDDTSWTSKEDWDGFHAMCKKTGNAVIGRRTYEVVKKEGTQLDDILTVVLTHDSTLLAKQSPHTIFTDKPPKDILTMLERKGFKEALIAGGGILNTVFLKESLIDEIYIDIEPLILGRGIPLFADGDFAPRLKLLEVKQLGNRQTVQLHYKVLK